MKKLLLGMMLLSTTAAFASTSTYYYQSTDESCGVSIERKLESLNSKPEFKINVYKGNEKVKSILHNEHPTVESRAPHWEELNLKVSDKFRVILGHDLNDRARLELYETKTGWFTTKRTQTYCDSMDPVELADFVFKSLL